jgi:hypothetical protein
LASWAYQLVLASTPKRTHAEVDKQKSEKTGHSGTPRSNLARRVGMILMPASDAANQTKPEKQESSDLQPKNLADPSKRLEKATDCPAWRRPSPPTKALPAED